MATRTTDWPSAGHELALIAADDGETEERRNRALSELRPLIESTAADVATTFRQLHVRQDLLDDSFSHVAERLQQYRVTETGSFKGWLYRVLYHLGCDLRRRIRRGDLLRHARTGQAGETSPALDNVADTQAEPASGEAATCLANLFTELRKLLDRVRWEPSRAIDYYALLLIELRLRLAASFCRALAAQEVPAAEIADQVERWLPWSDEEGGRRFRRDLLCLQHCWRDACERLGKHGLRSLDVVEMLNRRSHPGQCPRRRGISG